MRLFVLFLWCTIGLTACSGSWQDYPVNNDTADTAPQIIRPDDVVTVTIYGEESLSGEYNVNRDGTIAMPLAGNIAVAGHTPQEAADIIKTAYEKGYLVNPDITVTMMTAQVFSILGEVMKGGSYPYKNNMTVLEAVALAGGFSYRANQQEFDLIRKNSGGQEHHIRALLSTRIQAGDTIRIRERFF